MDLMLAGCTVELVTASGREEGRRERRRRERGGEERGGRRGKENRIKGWR